MLADVSFVIPILLALTICLSWNAFIGIFTWNSSRPSWSLAMATLATSVALVAVSICFQRLGPAMGAGAAVSGVIAARFVRDHLRTDLAALLSGTLLMTCFFLSGDLVI